MALLDFGWAACGEEGRAEPSTSEHLRVCQKQRLTLPSKEQCPRERSKQGLPAHCWSETTPGWRRLTLNSTWRSSVVLHDQKEMDISQSEGGELVGRWPRKWKS